jgi:twinkle protein
MVTALDCKFIFLDHITMLVTGFENDDERKKLDYLSTRLAMLTRELDFTLFLISHVNDDGKTRGSRNISKVADLTVYMERDRENPDDVIRNTTKLMVKDNRLSGRTGPGGSLFFSQETYCLTEVNDAAPF